MKKKTRILSLLFVVIFALSLCGCSTIASIAKDAVGEALESDRVKDLLGGQTIQQYLQSSNIGSLLEKGVSIIDMLKDGASLDSLVEGGLTSDILEKAGVSLSDLEKYGITSDALAKYGLSLPGSAVETTAPAAVTEDGTYSSKDEVALYIHTYGHLPSNFITKSEAASLGWEGGSLEPYASGKSIGGDHFGNYEGLLPEADGRSYTECDIDTQGAEARGAKRIVFSNDGLVYYTEDHYETFTLLYGEVK